MAYINTNMHCCSYINYNVQKLPSFAAGGIKPSHSQNLPVSLRPTCSPFVFSVGLSTPELHHPPPPFPVAEASGVRFKGAFHGNSFSFRERDTLARSLALSLVTFVKHHASPLRISLSMRSFFGVFRVQPTACVLSRASTGTLTTTTTHSTPDGRFALLCVRPFSSSCESRLPTVVHRSQYFWIAPIHR